MHAFIDPMTQYVNLLQNTTTLEIIRDQCGRNETDLLPLVASAELAQVASCDLSQTFASIRDLLQCSNWYPLYETTTYEAVCYNGTEGFSWVATTQFAILFMAMMVLTLRSALDPLKSHVEDEDSDDGSDDSSRYSDEDEDNDKKKRDIPASYGRKEQDPNNTPSIGLLQMRDNEMGTDNGDEDASGRR